MKKKAKIRKPYKILQKQMGQRIVHSEYDDICDAALVMEELIREGVEARIEYGGRLWRY